MRFDRVTKTCSREPVTLVNASDHEIKWSYLQNENGEKSKAKFPRSISLFPLFKKQANHIPLCIVSLAVISSFPAALHQQSMLRSLSLSLTLTTTTSSAPFSFYRRSGTSACDPRKSRIIKSDTPKVARLRDKRVRVRICKGNNINSADFDEKNVWLPSCAKAPCDYRVYEDGGGVCACVSVTFGCTRARAR